MVYSLYIYKRRMAGYSTVFKQLLNPQVAAWTVTAGCMHTVHSRYVENRMVLTEDGWLFNRYSTNRWLPGQLQLAKYKVYTVSDGINGGWLVIQQILNQQVAARTDTIG